LPDGSRVDAEGGATLSYDEAAFADNRIVKLTGEALFDVIAATTATGAMAPFTVEANNLSVNVLGTVFRLAGVENTTEAIAVSLYEGSVGVTIDPEAEAGAVQETEILAAGERLNVNTLTGEREMELIPASEMAEQGFMPLLRFDEASLADLVLALELNHGVQFDLTQDIDNTRGRYTANFEGATLDEVLQMLSKIDVGLSFERSGDNVNIRRK
jgi:ferric-dicitrate binding protein FerR (iron transport regulator)